MSLFSTLSIGFSSTDVKVKSGFHNRIIPSAPPIRTAFSLLPTEYCQIPFPIGKTTLSKASPDLYKLYIFIELSFDIVIM